MGDLETAIILAPDESGGLPIFGLPAVRRLVLLIRQIGLKVAYLSRTDSLLRCFSDLLPSVIFYRVDDPSQMDRTVQDLGLSDGEKILVLKANHVVDPGSLRTLIEAAEGSGLYFMASGGEKGADGLYITSRADLVSVVCALWSPERSSATILKGAQHVAGIAGLPHTLDEQKQQREISEAKLVSALPFQTEAEDGFLARHVDRRFSQFISKRLANTSATPNQITVAGVAIGLLGAFLLSQPGYWLPLGGALAFLLCVVIDGVDGEVARLKLRESRFGRYFDIVTDNIVHVAIFTGIAIGLYRETGDWRYVQFLAALMAGFCLCVVSVYWCMLRRTSNELKNAPRATRLMTLLTNRDFAYLIVVLALIHRLNWFLIGAAGGTYLFAAALWVMTLYEKSCLNARTRS